MFSVFEVCKFEVGDIQWHKYGSVSVSISGGLYFSIAGENILELFLFGKVTTKVSITVQTCRYFWHLKVGWVKAHQIFGWSTFSSSPQAYRLSILT